MYTSVLSVCHRVRYLVEDKWPANGIPPPPQVSTEDEVLGSAFEEISRCETLIHTLMVCESS